MAVFHHIHNDLASALAERLTGEVIAPEHAEYDAARRVWNGMIDKRPALIARCAGADDVSAAVRFARDEGLPLAVRGGGHNVAGTAVVDDGLVIDLSAMRDVRMDHAAGTVHVQGGATWADVDRVTAPLGLAAPGGVVSETGVAGLALNGGVSHQRRRDGLTIDSLVSAQVVLADGRQVTASAGEHADLHWALRGGGGNFGVVTSSSCACTARARGLRAERPPTRSRTPRACCPVARRRRRRAGRAVPPPDDLVAARRGRSARSRCAALPYVGVAGMWAGDPAEGERVTRPPARAGHPAARHERARGLSRLPVLTGSVLPCGRRYHWKALYLDGLADADIATTVDWSLRRPSADTLVIIRHCGGAMSRVGAEETAFGDRSSEWMLSIDSTWQDAGGDVANVAYTRAFFDAAAPFSDGKTYFNFPGLLEEGDAAVRASYGANHARLARIKAAYDPDNRFRSTQNIRPAP
jgi:FAD/FMN-containing dehydrogenase